MPSLLLSCLGCGGKGESDDIKTLDYTHASLTAVPPDVFACERTLEELYLDSNQLSELPRELFYCHGLKTLGLSDNELTSLPPAVASLINLNTIDLSKNAISDIPDNIKGCKQLSAVDASINPLCRLPEGFTQLLSLQELYLNDTFLEYLPANFGRLSRLRILELRENQLNTLPKSIARLTALQRLDIGQNDFSELPEVIGSLINLTELWFDNNKVKSVPPLVGHLKKLTHLDACKNKVDWVAGEVENCTALTDLHLSSNNLKELPEQLGCCVALETLKVDDNALTRLPATLGGLVSLRELVASQNDLEELPASVGLLRALHTLHLDDNLLTDLPGELGSCCKLQVLTAASNRLTSVPGELGHLPCLAVLNLCDNLLPHLPVSLTKLKLRALWLSENQNKPKVQLQSEIQPSTGQRVLTCFMLPQQPRPHHPEAVEEDTFPGAGWEEQRRARTLIKFAFEGDVDKPGGRLSRAPTPYPKELKALARHARNLSALQKDPQRHQFVPQKEHSRPLVTDHTTNKSLNTPQRSNIVGDDDDEGEGGESGVITSPLPVLAPQAEERPLLREARNVRNNSTTLNGQQATDTSKGLPEMDTNTTPAADRPYAIGDRKVFGLAQVVSTARSPGEKDTPPPEHIPLLPPSTTNTNTHFITDKYTRPRVFHKTGMESNHEASTSTRQHQDEENVIKQQESTLTVKETTTTTPRTQQQSVTTTEDENNDTSSSSDSGYGNGKNSQQQSVDEPQISEGNSTNPSSPDPTLSFPSTPSSPPTHIISHTTSHQTFPSSTTTTTMCIPSPSTPSTTLNHSTRPLSLAPHPRLGHLAAPLTTSRPASIATGGQLEVGGAGRVNRPGSLALGALADSALLTRVPQEQRPGSLAAPINTVGIPPAPTRAASHMALNTSPSTRLHQHHHQHPMFRSQDLSRTGRSCWSHNTTNNNNNNTTSTDPHHSNGLVSIIDQVTSSLLEHDDSPPPKVTNTTTEIVSEPQQQQQHHHHHHPITTTTTSGPQQYQDPSGYIRDVVDGSNSSVGPANFTQDQPRGEVLHPTPHRPARPHHPHHPSQTSDGPLTMDHWEDSENHETTTDGPSEGLPKDHDNIEVTTISKSTTSQPDTPATTTTTNNNNNNNTQNTKMMMMIPSRIPCVSPTDYIGTPPPRYTQQQQPPHHPSSQSGHINTQHHHHHQDPNITPILDVNKSHTTPTTTTSTTTTTRSPNTSFTSKPEDPRRTSDTRIPTLMTLGPERAVGGESRIPTLSSGVSRGSAHNTSPQQSHGEPNNITTPGRTLSNLSQESLGRKSSTTITPNIDTNRTPHRPMGSEGGRVSHIPRTPTTPTIPPGPTHIHTPHTGAPTTPRQQQQQPQQCSGVGGGYGFVVSRPHHTPTSSQSTSRIQSPLGYPSPTHSGIRAPQGVMNSAINTPGIPLPNSQSPALSTQLTSPGSRASVTSTGSASRIPHITGMPSRLPGAGGSRHRVAPTSGQPPPSTPPGPQTPDGSGGSGGGGGRSGWMFGQHKNARVFPVVIEKNPDLGFTIGQSPSDPDDKSVYVTSVAGGGAASSALKVGDKLLQVDGADLRSASLPTAAAALANTNATVNLMVSRLQ
ncbi:hypothetical protein Pmani_034804 [Petrolisthes manimaculis]|uniref:PDZ domain-containing protein n=1 Tax=Petrolisthes manimaculis TaxID=1843537 RepID=A0AAE1NNM7_9EUCA|nr:hypothetical protein Pmani_034804 [Petrolisthes manimaculis]